MLEPMRRGSGVAAAVAAELASLSGRKAREDELERRIAEWTRTQEPREVMQLLQTAGVDAAVVETYRDLHEDPQLAHREHFRMLRHAVLGEHPVEALGYRLSATPAEIARPGPRLGEHGDRIYRDVLGLSDDEIAALEREGVLR